MSKSKMEHVTFTLDAPAVEALDAIIRHYDEQGLVLSRSAANRLAIKQFAIALQNMNRAAAV